MCFLLIGYLHSGQFLFKRPHAPALLRRQGFQGLPFVIEGADISHFHGAAVRHFLNPAQRETLRAANVWAVLVNPAFP